ncbi:MAG: threonine/serine exporter family protein [Lachnospiraceae bacterium]|nr:threonine/serine exporter family protein [Lachnoclostridium sp.]MDD7521236.1 threonine/serine exporter family protein [Lachnoclostridium sp.]MDY2598481.1 threonine/serine exporter family protein [Lachnospiraceae bacterium]
MLGKNFTASLEKNHMEIPWNNYSDSDSKLKIKDSSLANKASVIGRVGLIMLSCGTGAWRVRTSMNRLAKELGVTCSVDVGLMSIHFNCFDNSECIAQSLSLANTGVNTSKLYRIEQFVKNFTEYDHSDTSDDTVNKNNTLESSYDIDNTKHVFSQNNAARHNDALIHNESLTQNDARPQKEARGCNMTTASIHKELDTIEHIPSFYSSAKLGLAAALACAAFTFLLGGGVIEMLLVFIAAGIGNYIRTKMIHRHFTLLLNISVSISVACLIYALCLKFAQVMFNVSSVHEPGYMCSILFIIPGFPFITSGIDLAKLDLRSGIERLTYSSIIVLVATVFAWIMALILNLTPSDFTPIHMNAVLRLVLRIIASFCGVLGFSFMFNSSLKMAGTAALIGCLANTLRLELVDFTAMPAAAAAFIGALTAGLLASVIKKNSGYPRITLTVPSIVIMVPGLYLYKAIYNFGIMSLSDAVTWFISAVMIIIALPLGLIFARILTDKTFRHCN